MIRDGTTWDKGIYNALLSASSLVGEVPLLWNLEEEEEERSHHRLKRSRSPPRVEQVVSVVLLDSFFSSVCFVTLLLPNGPCGECSHLRCVCEILDDLCDLLSLTFS